MLFIWLPIIFLPQWWQLTARHSFHVTMEVLILAVTEQFVSSRFYSYLSLQIKIINSFLECFPLLFVTYSCSVKLQFSCYVVSKTLKFFHFISKWQPECCLTVWDNQSSEKLYFSQKLNPKSYIRWQKKRNWIIFNRLSVIQNQPRRLVVGHPV